MENYWPEFLSVVVIHLLAVASPGPDFAVIIRQSLCQSRHNAVLTALGIGSGISVHVIYSLLGLGLIISQSVFLFTIIKYLGAAYLLYVGWQCLRSQPSPLPDVDGNPASGQTGGQAFRLGFLTNALNPKATLFFVALFSVVIAHDTPLWVQAGYGLWMVLATAAWFAGLSVLLTHRHVRRWFARVKHWIERAMGLALFAFAAKLASSEQS